MEPLRVLIVDDSALMRNLIGRIIQGRPGMAVAGTAMNGLFALKKLKATSVDAIVLDLEMPDMNGIEFLKMRRELKIDTPVIILSSIAKRGAEVTMEALSLGASDFITKPSGSISEDIHTVSEHLVELIWAHAGRGRNRSELEHLHPSLSAPPTMPLGKMASSSTYSSNALKSRILPGHPQATGPFELVVLGISTGGPNALRQVFQDLDPHFPLPIAVVQHMPPGFTAEFARSLNKVCPLEVKEAEDGDMLKPGRILIAPGDFHMEVEKKSLGTVVRTFKGEARNGHRPSAGVLFLSAAQFFGSQTLAVIMTGMGRDGADEIGEIRKAGGLTLGQDEESSVVYGMPKVAWELNHVERQVSLNDMASTLNTLSVLGRKRT